MGVMSRRVVPVCGSLCFFCPSLRARSRQPVKRYKPLLADIFPRSQDAVPNDRKIAKLCEYAMKNPLRIPKITEFLEQRFYKDLRNQHMGSVKVVLCVYTKLLSSCKEQMPLFANSLLGTIRTLLEQTPHEEIQVLGCSALAEFINCQVDSSYMFNLEGVIPKLCQLAQEVGDNNRALRLRAAGLRALASMVLFMGDHSQMSMDLDNIISATLENYMDINPANGEVMRLELNCSSLSISTINIKEELEPPPLDASSNPSYWSRVCLHNMVGLAKEATTVRRVLEPFFSNFDSEDYWALEKGVALSVLKYFHQLLEESGENSHMLLSMLVKHLDHKNVVKQPLKQINILNVTMYLSQYAKQQVSVAITGALTDLMKHLRKCMQYSAEASSRGNGADKLNADLQSAIEQCILALSKKIGDAGPMLDVMAVALENIPANYVVARATISAACRTAQIISCVPNVSYYQKAFPDALFHQLLLAMAHQDNETRIGAHYVFSVVIMPSLLNTWLSHKGNTSLKYLRFPSILKGKSDNNVISDERESELEAMGTKEEEQKLMPDLKQCSDVQKHVGSCSFKCAMTNGNKEMGSLRLSSHQISLLLSSIWVQAISAENTPENFEAMALTYNIALLFTSCKTSSHVGLVRCFQLAFSLRSIALDHEGNMQPSQRQSLFTLASYMLIFSARAGNLPELIPVVKSSLTDKTVDPCLELVEDIRVQAVNLQSSSGSEDSAAAALKSLSAMRLDDQKSRESVISHFMTKFDKLSEEDLFRIKKQLLQGFSPDDAYPLGSSLFMETPRPGSPALLLNIQPSDEVEEIPELLDDDSNDANGSQSGRKTSISTNSIDIVNVNQLLESVLETAQQVASLPTCTAVMPYDEVKNQCEALVTGKHQKMSVLHNIKQQHESKAIISVPVADQIPTSPLKKRQDWETALQLINSEAVGSYNQLFMCSIEYGQEQSFRLPPSSPYDKFLSAL
ncbi:uncharacterized protein [Phyllobates terribilis]|uniref:uncharacterized protein n=1 Tax=Phyllobates terribilis TaxID=111132 RepID=UPI003CCB4539